MVKLGMPCPCSVCRERWVGRVTRPVLASCDRLVITWMPSSPFSIATCTPTQCWIITTTTITRAGCWVKATTIAVKSVIWILTPIYLNLPHTVEALIASQKHISSSQMLQTLTPAQWSQASTLTDFSESFFFFFYKKKREAFHNALYEWNVTKTNSCVHLNVIGEKISLYPCISDL